MIADKAKVIYLEKSNVHDEITVKNVINDTKPVNVNG